MGYEANFTVTELKHCKPGDLILIEYKGERAIAFSQFISQNKIGILLIAIFKAEKWVRFGKSFYMDYIDINQRVASFGNRWSIQVNWQKILFNKDIRFGAILIINNSAKIVVMDRNRYELYIDLNDFKEHDTDYCYTSIDWSLYVLYDNERELLFQYGNDTPRASII